MGYRNPILPGFHPDPSLCRVGEDFYLVTSSFEYFPGVPVFHSRDLVHWRQIGHCLTRENQLPLAKAWASGGIYAPTLRWHGGKFWMITTNVSGGGHFLVTAEDPAGEWSDPIWCEGQGIDPSLAWDGDDCLMTYTNGGHDGSIMQARLDVRTGRHLEPAKPIWAGTEASGTEGPHLFFRNGWWYLLVAEGGTEPGHIVSVARSRSPWGEFESCPHNPVLTHRSTWHPIQTTGHADLVETQNGEWWLVCLGTRPTGYPMMHVLGRETFLAPVEWVDDWPVVNGGRPLELEMPTAPDLPMHIFPERPTRDDFDRLELDFEWNFLRNPDPNDWTLSERPGWLRLRGSAVAPGDMASLAFVGRRQSHHRFKAAALMEFDPSDENEEAGLTLRMNERHRIEAFVTRVGPARRFRVRRTVGSLQKTVLDETIAPAGFVVLTVEGDEQHYSMRVLDASGAEFAQGGMETRHLSTELAGGFTGVYVGMFATGNGRACSVPADFDWFDYEPKAPDLVP